VDTDRAVDDLDRLVNHQGHADMTGVLASALEGRRLLLAGGRQQVPPTCLPALMWLKSKSSRRGRRGTTRHR
jgi:hypothetical protein